MTSPPSSNQPPPRPSIDRTRTDEEAHAARATSFVSGIHRIEARLLAGRSPTRGGVVVAHPHPAHGGNMDHPVVVTAAARAAHAGLTALRFDFRGVGQSEGRRDDAEGHLEDWRAAARDLRRRVPSGPLLGAGFSYGARALARLLHGRVEPAPALAGVLLLAPATRVPRTPRDFGNLLLGRPLTEAALDEDVLRHLRELQGPAEVIVGANDVVAPHEELAANLPAHARLQVLPDLNHFFSRHRGAGVLAHEALGDAIDISLARLLDA